MAATIPAETPTAINWASVKPAATQVPFSSFLYPFLQLHLPATHEPAPLQAPGHANNDPCVHDESVMLVLAHPAKTRAPEADTARVVWLVLRISIIHDSYNGSPGQMNASAQHVALASVNACVPLNWSTMTVMLVVWFPFPPPVVESPVVTVPVVTAGVGAGVGSSVGVGVGVLVGGVVGLSVGFSVGGFVGSSVGVGVDAGVAEGAGVPVGVEVGVSVGGAVGGRVTIDVGTGVGDAGVAEGAGVDDPPSHLNNPFCLSVAVTFQVAANLSWFSQLTAILC